jgi:hypothetical protein
MSGTIEQIKARMAVNNRIFKAIDEDLKRRKLNPIRKDTVVSRVDGEDNFTKLWNNEDRNALDMKRKLANANYKALDAINKQAATFTIPVKDEKLIKLFEEKTGEVVDRQDPSAVNLVLNQVNAIIEEINVEAAANRARENREIEVNGAVVPIAALDERQLDMAIEENAAVVDGDGVDMDSSDEESESDDEEMGGPPGGGMIVAQRDDQDDEEEIMRILEHAAAAGIPRDRLYDLMQELLREHQLEIDADIAMDRDRPPPLQELVAQDWRDVDEKEDVEEYDDENMDRELIEDGRNWMVLHQAQQEFDAQDEQDDESLNSILKDGLQFNIDGVISRLSKFKFSLQAERRSEGDSLVLRYLEQIRREDAPASSVSESQPPLLLEQQDEEKSSWFDTIPWFLKRSGLKFTTDLEKKIDIALSRLEEIKSASASASSSSRSEDGVKDAQAMLSSEHKQKLAAVLVELIPKISKKLELDRLERQRIEEKLKKKAEEEREKKLIDIAYEEEQRSRKRIQSQYFQVQETSKERNQREAREKAEADAVAAILEKERLELEKRKQEAAQRAEEQKLIDAARIKRQKELEAIAKKRSEDELKKLEEQAEAIRQADAQKAKAQAMPKPSNRFSADIEAENQTFFDEIREKIKAADKMDTKSKAQAMPKPSNRFSADIDQDWQRKPAAQAPVAKAQAAKSAQQSVSSSSKPAQKAEEEKNPTDKFIEENFGEVLKPGKRNTASGSFLSKALTVLGNKQKKKEFALLLHPDKHEQSQWKRTNTANALYNVLTLLKENKYQEDSRELQQGIKDTFRESEVYDKYQQGLGIKKRKYQSGGSFHSPSFRPFGAYCISMGDLDKGTLSLYYKNGVAIKAIPKTRISSDFRNIIYTVIEQDKLPHASVAALADPEKALLSKVLHHMKLARKLGMDYYLEKTDQDDLDRMDILKSMIQEGNDSPKVLDELKLLTKKMMDKGHIKKAAGVKILASLV